MRIIVLVKEVPDTYGDRVLDSETGLADRGASERVLDEIGGRALEAAVSLRDQHPDAEIVVLSMGPDSLPATLRKALGMGADRAVHIVDEGLLGADLTLTAEVLASAIARVGFDLVVAGNLSTDGTAGMIPAMVAEHLRVPSLTNLTTLDLAATQVAGDRATETGSARVSAPLPAVVSITEAFPDARFPNFKSIMAAKKKPTETLTLADLGVDAEAMTPRSIMLSVAKRPARTAGVKITDEGDAGTQLADYLISNRLV